MTILVVCQEPCGPLTYDFKDMTKDKASADKLPTYSEAFVSGIIEAVPKDFN